MNWGYNGAYFFKQLENAAPKTGGALQTFPRSLLSARCSAPAVPSTAPITMIENWFAHSPIAHVPTITCPVSVYWTTADMLVPMNQIGARWVQPFREVEVPGRLHDGPGRAHEQPRRPAEHSSTSSPEGDYEVFNLNVPEGTARHNIAGRPRQGDHSRAAGERGQALVDRNPRRRTARARSLDHRKFNLH